MALHPCARVGSTILLLLAAGCFTPNTSTPAGFPTSSSTGDGVILAGHIQRIEGGWAANVTAHNVGTASYGWVSLTCIEPYGAMRADMAGPEGDPVIYRNPEADYLGCPGHSSILGPGGWVNWTVDPVWTASQCSRRDVCDNYWDGRLWHTGAGSPEPYPAPPGTYRWHFSFEYSESQKGTASPPGTPSHRVELNLTLAMR